MVTQIEEVGKELLAPSIDLGMDYTEIGLDEFFGEGLLKEVPIVKTLVAVAKTGIAIRERFFIKKFLVFLRELHSGMQTEEDLKAFKEKFDSNSKFRNKVTEEVILIVDRLDSTKKARISAHLFRAHIQGEYDWDRYIALDSCLRNLQEVVYPVLEVMAKNDFANMNTNPTLAELKAALDPVTGKLDFESQRKDSQSLLMAAGIGFISGSFFGITSLGRDLYTHGIAKILP